MHAAWNGFATLPLLKSGENWEYFSYLLIAIMIILCLAFIVKSLEYGKYYSRLELAAASFEDLEEEQIVATNQRNTVLSSDWPERPAVGVYPFTREYGRPPAGPRFKSGGRTINLMTL